MGAGDRCVVSSLSTSWVIVFWYSLRADRPGGAGTYDLIPNRPKNAPFGSDIDFCGGNIRWVDDQSVLVVAETLDGSGFCDAMVERPVILTG